MTDTLGSRHVHEETNEPVTVAGRAVSGTMRRVQPETDLPGLSRLSGLCFASELTPEQLRWKYAPPWADRVYSQLGFFNGEIMAHIGVVPLRGVSGGAPRPFFQIADIMLHPTARGKAPWTAGAQLVLDNVLAQHPDAVFYGFADRQTFTWYKWIGFAALVDDVREFTVRRDASTPAGTDTITVEAAEWDDDEIDVAWSRAAGELESSLTRDRAYLRWRYEMHPALRYRLFTARREGALLGWMVQLRTHKEAAEGRAWVVDMLLPRPLAATCLGVLAGTLEVPAVSCWLPSSFQQQLGEAKRNGLVLMSLKSSLRVELLKKQHFFTAGDADLF